MDTDSSRKRKDRSSNIFGVLYEQNLKRILDRCAYDIPGKYEDEFNWVETKVVSPDVVGNQGSCSACWAWGAAGAVQYLRCIRKFKCPQLSPQDIIDGVHGECAKCRGAQVGTGLEWIKRNGVCELDNYKYYGKRSEPQERIGPKHKIDGWRLLKDDEEVMMNALKEQPLIVTIPLATAVNQYKGGLLDLSKAEDHHTEDLAATTPSSGAPPETSGHTVLLVGYGTFYPDYWPSVPIKYWIVKNQWGTDWGVNGFGYIVRNSSVFEFEGEINHDMKEQLRWYFAPVIPMLKENENDVLPECDKVRNDLSPAELATRVSDENHLDDLLLYLFYQRSDPSKEEQAEKDFRLFSRVYEHDSKAFLAKIDVSKSDARDRFPMLKSRKTPALVIFKPVDKKKEPGSKRNMGDAIIFKDRKPLTFATMMQWIEKKGGKRLGCRDC